MDQELKEQLSMSISGLRLPRYQEIPNVGFYLEQTVKYINESLCLLSDEALTSSMVSNYVKRGLISNPHKKQYSREQVAYLIFIAVVKTVLSMDDIRLIINVQKRTYATQVAYDYFCCELENVLAYLSGQQTDLATIGTHNTDEKIMLRNVIITSALKLYLGKLFAVIQQQPEYQE